LAYDLPGTANADVLWGTGRADFGRTSLAAGVVTCTQSTGTTPGAFPAGAYHLFLPILRRYC
jgi:hypothetical protein